MIFDPEFTDMYFKASGQLSTSDMKLLTSGDMGADAYTQLFVQQLGNTIDNPFKSPKFYAVMDDVVTALQAIIQGGDVASQLASADRRITRTMSR